MTDPLASAAVVYHSTGIDHSKAREALYAEVRQAIAAGRTKADVARVAGISRETIYAILKGGPQ